MYCNDFKAFISYLNDIGDIYKNIEEHNPNKKGKIFIVLHDMTADTLCHKKFNLTVTELFIRGKDFSCFYYLILFWYTKKY